MKRANAFILCFAVILLLSGAFTAHAQGIQSIQDASVQEASAEITFDRLYLIRAETGELPWEQTSTVVDKVGAVHTAFFTNQSIYYAYCPSNCGQLASWKAVAISPAGDYDSLVYPVVQVDSSNRPRLMYYLEPDYYYAECNANCMVAASWNKVKIIIPTNSSIYPYSSRYFALDPQNHPRFVTYQGYHDWDTDTSYVGFTYNTCDSGCTIGTNWKVNSIDLGSGNWVGIPQLVMNSLGQPRVMGAIAVSSGPDKLIYLGCDTGCNNKANWKQAILYEIGSYNYEAHIAFRLDAQNRPRVAFYTSVVADQTMYYAWSNSSAAGSTAWTRVSLSLPPNDYRTVDLAIDTQGRPSMVFATDKEDLGYIVCTANCNTTSATWAQQFIETGDALDVIDPIPLGGCLTSVWMMQGYPSMALNAAGLPVVSYNARHYRLCKDNYGKYQILPDVWALRFATPGTSGPVPSKDIKLYLPLLRK